MRKKLYICDGKVPTCRKTYCAFNGTGECMHTEDKSHARYDGPREWDIEFASGRTVFYERERRQ